MYWEVVNIAGDFSHTFQLITCILLYRIIEVLLTYVLLLRHRIVMLNLVFCEHNLENEK
jgi:hypothetical protein